MSEQTQKVVDYLNSAYKCDPAAIHALICINIPCNQELVDHPDVVVSKNNVVGNFTVSTLGLLNGALTASGMKRVAMKWSDTKNKDGRYEFEGFVIADEISQKQ